MDFYDLEKKLDDIEEFPSIAGDMFSPLNTGINLSLDNGVDSEWLDNFLDDPVLNDCMMSDALQPVHVQSEHSYSLTNEEGQNHTNNKAADFENDIIQPIDPSTTAIKREPVMKGQSLLVKKEPCHNEKALEADRCDSIVNTKDISPSNTQNNMCYQTSLRQPTIILAANPHIDSSNMKHDSNVFSNINIKVEPAESITSSPPSSPEHHGSYDSIRLPPTPPSSNSSDSEGGLSPRRASPCHLRHQSMTRQQAIKSVTQSQLFSSPIPTSGILLLSEEEKRTLISEGYPIPTKLPLTKQEEKNLKKIRRKIKNKISAQESRRKKKEYLETLEKKVESFNTENVDLRRKVDQLENNNRSLVSQLHKLQNLAGKLTSATTPSQTGTCLMVLVVFFAVFLGSWSPMSLQFGSSSHQISPATILSQNGPNELHYTNFIGPKVQDATTGDIYKTPSVRSRVLMSLRDDEGEGVRIQSDCKGIVPEWLYSSENSCQKGEAEFVMMPPSPDVITYPPEKGIIGSVSSIAQAENMTGPVTTGSLMNNATS